MMKNNLEKIKNSPINKYEEIINYLKQDNNYWLDNDKWDLTEKHFMGELIYRKRYIDFSNFKNALLKNEIKYYIIFSFKENKLSNKYLLALAESFKNLSDFCNKFYLKTNSFSAVEYEKFHNKWILYLSEVGIKNDHERFSGFNIMNILFVIKFISNFYDTREEIEKDIWHSQNIKGARVRATQSSTTNKLNFTLIPQYYREMQISSYYKRPKLVLLH